ncbi:Membrane associated serine protease, rhomboid family [Flavobacterium fontis]|uniref:Membrane associated serine protease, rhomboid family n=1 Tax=Flavobacterium fontis TaxID=1124188 RepID=A0A1M5C2W6_9FLAO|nr:rhomboid family intramembrane serine protease [Flavobacterium fontis]SHF48772.1 Membrane associated serine protease, rhomboid family [Flavobacterium fontis]
MRIWEDIKLQYRIGGIVNQVIYWNVGVFILAIPFFYQFREGFFAYPDWLALSSSFNAWLFKPWTLISYGFLHSGFFHLFFNMVMLNFAGRLFQTFFTQKQFLGMYLFSLLFSGLAYSIAYTLLGGNGIIVGASGAVLAVLTAVTVYQPLMELRLLLIGNVKLWHVTGVILLLDVLQISMSNTGGHIAHLAGATFGVLYMKLLQSGTDLSQPVTKIITFFATLGQPKSKSPFTRVHKNPQRKTTSTTSKVVLKDKKQQQIDEILDKISQSGYDSLTQAEKEFLFRAGNE